MSEWIKALKAGDTVIMAGRWGGKQVRTVDKVTPSGIIKIGGTSFSQHGFERGVSDVRWGTRHHLEEATPERLEDIRQKAVIDRALILMRGTGGITYEQADAIINVLVPTETEATK
jgi:hypothetical protein